MKHTEDGLLLEKVRYEDDKDNETTRLSILDQTILLALCLDVKNANPESDVLTGEEMGAYLSSFARTIRLDGIRDCLIGTSMVGICILSQ